MRRGISGAGTLESTMIVALGWRIFDTLHCGGSCLCPLSRVTIVLQWRKHACRRKSCWRLLMLKLIGEISVDMRSVWIETIKMLKHGLHLTAQHSIFFLVATAQISLVSHSLSFAANGITAVLQILDVFDGCNDKVSVWDTGQIYWAEPLVRISHLLDFPPGEFGRMLLSSSNSDFISLRRLRSAILWLTRSSGVRL